MRRCANERAQKYTFGTVMLRIATLKLRVVETPDGHEVTIAGEGGMEDVVLLARTTTKDEADRFVRALLSALATLQTLAAMEAKRG